MTKPTKDDVPSDFWKHAQVRRDCLMEAVKARPDNPMPLANQMYKFIIGEPTIEPTTVEKEWK